MHIIRYIHPMVQLSTTSIHLKASERDRDLIDYAAELAGVNRTQFMLSAAVREAKNTVLDETAITVTPDTFQEIANILDRDAEPSDAMRKLFQHQAPWKA